MAETAAQRRRQQIHFWWKASGRIACGMPGTLQAPRSTEWWPDVTCGRCLRSLPFKLARKTR